METRGHDWVVALTLCAVSCAADTTPPTAEDGTSGIDLDTVLEALADASPDCDPLVPDVCAMPWPSNQYLISDDQRVTGYTLTFGETSLPANIEPTHPTPTPYLQLDGYAIGSTVLAYWPDLDGSTLATEEHMAPSLAEDAPVLLYRVLGGSMERVPYWTQMDLNEDNPGRRTLAVEPAVILEEATRYVVAFRDLDTTSGEPIQPSPAFAALRDGIAADVPLLAPRVERFEEIFGLLASEGIDRADLLLAWDFVTASSEALHGKMLQIRDLAFEATGPQGPELTIDEMVEFTEEENADIALELEGTFRVPHFMEEMVFFQEETAWTMSVDDNGDPVQNGWRDARFWIRIPRTALDGSPHGLIMYGHGLNGSGTQVRGGHNGAIASHHHYIFYAADMVGMSEEDVDNISLMILELGSFPILSDRMHQGLVEHLLLTRTMTERFPLLEEITSRGIVVDTSESYYSGISQGGIYGATIMALSQDIIRGHLGVPGQNYSLLLQRSIDFEPFFAVLKLVYPDQRDQLVLLEAVQCLWDRVDPSSYYRHVVAEPFPGNEPHHVLLASATGDWQVALLTNEITVRSGLGVALMPDYGKEVFNVEPVDYPHVGSGLVNYSFGNPWPPEGNLPPQDDLGDPHGKPRKLDHHREQLVHFLETGEIIDVCGGDGCAPD